MFAVIFRAQIRTLDNQYDETARRMRELATTEYGCLDFVSLTQGDEEIAISYWNNEADILRWKQDVEHINAQQLGQSRWYKNYRVEVVEIKRHYSSHDDY